MEKIRRYGLILLAFIAISAIAASKILYDSVVELQKDKDRLQNNVRITFETLQHYRTTDSLNAATIHILKLEKSELESTNSSLKRNIKDLRLKIKDVDRISAFNMQSTYNISAKLSDSSEIVRDSFGRSVDTISTNYVFYKDEWVDFRQRQYNGNAETSIKTRDSIVVVQSWDRYRFLWFRFGKKNHTETIKNYNPYSDINFAISVRVDE